MGIARMFQTLNDNPQISIRIFTNAAEAMSWLQGEPVARNANEARPAFDTKPE